MPSTPYHGAPQSPSPPAPLSTLPWGPCIPTSTLPWGPCIPTALCAGEGEKTTAPLAPGGRGAGGEGDVRQDLSSAQAQGAARRRAGVGAAVQHEGAVD